MHGVGCQLQKVKNASFPISIADDLHQSSPHYLALAPKESFANTRGATLLNAR